MRVRYAIALSCIVAGALMLGFGARPVWWFGGGFATAGVALALWTGRATLRRWRDAWSEPTEVWGVEFVPLHVGYEALCILTLAGVAIAMLPEAFLGERPTDHDHAVHYYKAWQLEKEFLLDGRFWGWSHHWFAGYPAQYLYPVGADLLVVGIHVASLGLLAFSQAYALAIWLFWFLRGYVVYRLASTGFDRWVGLLAGFLFMTDTAANRIGGWYFAMKWGVWPMSLAIVFAVWAVARLPRLLEGDARRDLAIFGLLVAAALLSHPFMMVYLGLTLPVALFAYWLADGEGEWLIGTGRVAVGVAVGAALALFWLAPFMSSSHFMDPNFGGRWTSLFQMGRQLYHVELLPGTWGVVTAFGAIGIVALVWTRRFLPLTVGLLALTFLVVGSTDFLAGFHALEAFPSLQKLHFKRFIALLKPYWIVAAAYAAVLVVRHGTGAVFDQVAEQFDGPVGQSGAWAIWGRVFVVGICLLPIAVPVFQEFGSQHLSRDLTEPDERRHRRAREQLGEWFRNRHSEEQPFFRVGMWLSRHNHSFVDFGAEIPHPLYKMGYMPATSYRYSFESDDLELLETLNVRYVVALHPLRQNAFERIEQFGSLYLYRFKRWQKEPFEIVEGEGSVQVKQFDTESIVLEAADGSEGRLRLNVSHFDRWHVTRNGEPIDVEAVPLGGFDHKYNKTGFMTVELKPGTYRFEFRRGWTEWFSLLVSLLALAAVLALVAADLGWKRGAPLIEGLDRLEEMVRARIDAHPALVGWLGRGGLVGVLLFTAVLAWMAPPIHVRDAPFDVSIEEVHYDFADHLRHASVSVGNGPEARACRQVFDRFVCGREIWKHVHTRIEDFGPSHSMYRCIRAHPMPEGPIQIRFSDVPAGKAIVGHYGVAESGKIPNPTPVDLKVSVDGVYRWSGQTDEDQEVYTFRAAIPQKARDGAMDVRFQVDAGQTGKRHFCFNAQVVDVDDATARGE